MKQILLVLRKDCRKFWPEIVLTLAVTCAFVWAYPLLWMSEGSAVAVSPGSWFRLDQNHLETLARVCTVLLPVSWLLLIARVVHDENLVGTKQFWITRPYRWQWLLIEKLLFVGLFVCAPFTAAQMALLLRAGFHPLQYIPGLAYCLLTIVITVVLPIFAISAVTSSLLRIIGMMVGAAVCIAVAAFLFPSTIIASPASVPYSSDRLILPIILAFSAGILFVQYSGRKVWLGRTLLVALAVSLVIAASDPFDVAMLERIYGLPEPGHADSIHAVAPKASVDRLGISRLSEKLTYVKVPIAIIGIPNGEAVTPDNIRLTINAPGGAHWISPWQGIDDRRVTATETGSETYVVAVDQTFLSSIKSGPLSLTVDLALTRIAPGKPAKVEFVTGKDFAVPLVGICKQTYGDIQCRVPFHQPALVQVAAIESPVPCDTSHPVPPGWQIQTAWVGKQLSPALADIGFAPVWTSSIKILDRWYQPQQEDKATQLTVCPGTPMTVTPFHLVNRFQSQVKMTVGEIDTSPGI